MLTLLISTLISISLVLVFRLLNKPHKPPIYGIYQQKNKYYWFKYVFMFVVLTVRQAVTRFKRAYAVDSGKSCDGTIHIHDEDALLEKKYDFRDCANGVDAVYFNGISTEGNAVMCALARRPKQVCDASMIIKELTWLSPCNFVYVDDDIGPFLLNKRYSGIVNISNSDITFGCNVVKLNGDVYLTPSLPDTQLQQVESEVGEYKVQGMHIENFMPMRSWKLTYSGDMKSRSDSAKMVKVEADLLWSALWPPFNFDYQLSPHSVAKDIARENWSTDFFNLLKKFHQSHYEQMGTLKGTIKIDGKEQYVKMPCLRDHSFGKYRDWRNFHRYVFHVIFLENGDCIAVGSVSQPVTISHLSFGYVCRKSEHAAVPVDSCDFQMYQHGENQVLPKDYGFSFRAGSEHYTVRIQVQDEELIYIGKNREAKFYDRWSNVEVNGVKGNACAQWHYNNVQTD